MGARYRCADVQRDDQRVVGQNGRVDVHQPTRMKRVLAKWRRQVLALEYEYRLCASAARPVCGIDCQPEFISI